MGTQNTTDEVSVGELGGVFRKLYHFFLIRFYRIFRFFLKSWFVLLGLIIIGGIIGYFQMKDKSYPKKAELLVQINYGGANYIYNAVDLLSKKIQEKDTLFLKEHNLFHKDRFDLRSLEIEPIINLNEILYKNPNYNRNYEILLNETETKDKLLASELFRNQYRIHKLTLNTSRYGDDTTIKSTIDFLNQHPAFQDTKAIYIQNLNNQIKETKFSISRIDSIFNKLGSSVSSKSGNGQVYVNTQDYTITDLPQLLQEKSRLIDYLQQLEVDQVSYENPVVLKSQEALVPEKGMFTNRIIWIPILLIFFFTGLSLLWYLLRKGKRLSERR
ncbi:MAG TPA: hypothetical protein VK021_00670 [Flavobacteriaceae bacterium]|nr:hypothetical protein [Flavobacteriaceae bacterium]